MRLRHVNDNHYAVYGQEDTAFGRTPSPRLPGNAHQFWERWGLGEADEGVVATHEEKLVGFFRFSMDEDTLWAAGTWVAPSFRRQGLATRMWDKAFRMYKPSNVYVTCATQMGFRFVGYLRRQHPTIFNAFQMRRP